MDDYNEPIIQSEKERREGSKKAEFYAAVFFVVYVCVGVILYSVSNYL